VINAPKNSDNNLYIQSLNLNGKRYGKSYLNYEDLQKGGELNFDMSSTPNATWAGTNDDVPYSFSKER